MTTTTFHIMRAAAPILRDQFDGSVINQGRNYAEYVEERKKKKEQEFWEKLNRTNVNHGTQQEN